LILCLPPRSTLFPYTTLFRSNRTVAFNLPSDIENKLTKLMNVLSLNFGSIDMIVSKNREYYFLEVNPVGQFGMVSFPCNYNIERSEEHTSELQSRENLVCRLL